MAQHQYLILLFTIELEIIEEKIELVCLDSSEEKLLATHAFCMTLGILDFKFH